MQSEMFRFSGFSSALGSLAFANPIKILPHDPTKDRTGVLEIRDKRLFIAKSLTV